MTSTGMKRMGWALVIVVVGAVLTGAALQYAIGRNGPAVLDNVDWLTAGSRDVSLVKSVSLGDAEAQKLAIYRAGGQNSDPKPVLIFVHGGSWRSGNADNYGFFARGLAPEGFVVVLAGYRLGEAGQFPGMLEDTASAIAWVKANIADYGGDPNAIFLAGHSAGAYNVVMTALDRQWLGRAGLEDGAVRGVIGLAGPYDFYPFDSDSTKAAFGKAPDPEKTQPINVVRGDAPPMLLMTGEKDTVVRPRNTRVLSAAIDQAGGSVETRYFPEMDHNAIIMATASPWRRDARVVAAMDAFMKRLAAQPGRQRLASVPVQAESR